MKTINIITNYFPPHIAPPSNRIFALTNVLSKHFKVRVFYNCEKHEIFKPDASLENVDFIPVIIKGRKKNNFIFRVIRETVDSLRLNFKTIGYPCDITIVTVPDLMLLPVSSLFNLLLSRKSIVDIRDLIWRYAEFKSGFIYRFFNNALTFISKHSLKTFSRHVCVTNEQKYYLDSFCNKKFQVVCNGIESSKFEKLAEVEQSSNGNEFVVTYAGTLGFPQNLVSLFPAFEKLSNHGVVINIIGNGVQYNELKELVNASEITNVNIIGKIDWDRLLEYYSASDLLFAQLRDAPSINTAEPSKLFEYYSTGKPVLYLGKGAAQDLVSNFTDTWIIEPEDSEAFYEKVLKIINADKNETRLNENRNIIKSKYIRECQLADFIGACESFD